MHLIISTSAKINGKVVLSSLLRSHASGRITVGVGFTEFIFRIPRAGISEFVTSGSGDVGDYYREWSYLLTFDPPASREWVVFVNPAGLALRNIDHLFPPELEGPYARQPVDFLWARVHDDPRSGPRDLAAPGIWAVRGEHAEMVLGRLKEAWDAEPEATEADETRIWSQVVRDLPLRKRAFERGEVLCPPVGAVDWKALCSAVLVTIPHWPEPERWKFLQALYFGTYLVGRLRTIRRAGRIQSKACGFARSCLSAATSNWSFSRSDPPSGGCIHAE